MQGVGNSVERHWKSWAQGSPEQVAALLFH